MTMQKMTVPQARLLAMALLVAVTLAAGSIACRGDDPPATATPSFSLPTALPSPEAVSTTAAVEATVARSSTYWDGPTQWDPRT